MGSKLLGSEASVMVMHYLRSDPIDGIFCIVSRKFTNRKKQKTSHERLKTRSLRFSRKFSMKLLQPIKCFGFTRCLAGRRVYPAYLS